MKILKITGYAFLYLILSLIIMPIIVDLLQQLTGLDAISNMIGVVVRIMLALQISRRINTVTQNFPNYLRTKAIKIQHPNLVQGFWYLVYFSLIYLMALILNILNLSTNILALIITTLLKLLITYIIANIVRYIVSQKPRNILKSN